MSSDPRTRGTALPAATSERKVRDLDPSVEAELRLQLMQLRDHAIGATAQVLTETAGDAAKLKENLASLNKNLASLSQVYGNMLSAMKA